MSTDSKYAAQVFEQSYAARPAIEGVEVIQLPLQSDDGGNFSEIARITGGSVEGLKAPFDAQQVSMSMVKPGAIKAFHLHSEQDDLWYTPPFERFVVNLHDVREGSATFDAHMRLVTGGGKNLLLRIPKGVAHGIGNPYEKDMMLFYLTNQKFDIKNPDEHRLPWDIFGTDIWEITKG
jgi:dTDP-4-dehydrorhamnose 3,5-epimerase